MNDDQRITEFLKAVSEEEDKHALKASERLMATLRQRREKQVHKEKTQEPDTPRAPEVRVEFTGVITPEQQTSAPPRRVFRADEPEQGKIKTVFTAPVLPKGKDEWAMPPFPPEDDDRAEPRRKKT